MSKVPPSSPYAPVRFGDSEVESFRDPNWFTPPAKDLGIPSAIGGNVRLGLNAIPEAVGYRAVRNGLLDLYAHLSPFDPSVVNQEFRGGLIQEEEFKGLFHSFHPGMVGKWKKGMSWGTAQAMLEDLEDIDDDMVSVGDVNRPLLSFAAQTVPQFLSPTNYLALGHVAKGTPFLNGVGQAAAYGVAENMAIESTTYAIQKHYLQEDRHASDLAIAGVMGVLIPGTVQAGRRGLEVRKATRQKVLDRLAKEALGIKATNDLDAANTAAKTQLDAHVRAAVDDEVARNLEDNQATREAREAILDQEASVEADRVIAEQQAQISRLADAEADEVLKTQLTQKAAELEAIRTPAYNATLREELKRLLRLGAPSVKDAYEAARVIARAPEQQRGVVRSAAEAELGLGGRRDRRITNVQDLQDFHATRQAEVADPIPERVADPIPERVADPIPERVADPIPERVADDEVNINENVDRYGESTPEAFDPGDTASGEKANAASVLYKPDAENRKAINSHFIPTIPKASTPELIKAIESRLDRIERYTMNDELSEGMRQTIEIMHEEVRAARAELEARGEATNMPRIDSHGAHLGYVEDSGVGRAFMNEKVEKRAAKLSATADKRPLSPKVQWMSEMVSVLKADPSAPNIKLVVEAIRSLRERLMAPGLLDDLPAHRRDQIRSAIDEKIIGEYDKIFESAYKALAKQNTPALIRSLEKIIADKKAYKRLSQWEYSIYRDAHMAERYRSAQKEKAEADQSRKSPAARMAALDDVQSAGSYAGAMHNRSMSFSEWQQATVSKKRGKTDKVRENWFKFLSDFLTPYGRELRIYDHTDPTNIALFGHGRGATHWSDGNTIYIAADQLNTFDKGTFKYDPAAGKDVYVPGAFNPDSLLSVTGHEVAHTIRFRSETAYRKLVGAILETNDPGLRKIISDTLDEFEKSAAFRGFSAEKKFDEVMANVIGHAFKNKSFWRAVEELHGRGFFLKLVDHVSRFLKSIISKIRGDTDPAVGQTVRRMAESIEEAMRSSTDITRAYDNVSQLRGIYNDFSGKYRSLLHTIDMDLDRAVRNVEDAADEIVFELPDEGAHQTFTIPRIGDTSFVPTDFVIKMDPDFIIDFDKMSKKERAAEVYAQLFGHSGLAKPFQEHLAELAKNRKWGMNKGDIGEPLVIYKSEGKGNLRIYIGYPDDYGTIGIKRERYEHSRNSAMVRSWIGLPEVSQADVNPVAAELAHLIDVARRVVEYGEGPRSERLDDFKFSEIREFIESPEFKGLLDVHGEADGSKMTEKQSAMFADTFVEAMSAYNHRIITEHVERGAPIPDKYASWQDRTQEYQQKANEFLPGSDKIIVEPNDIGPGRAQAAKLYTEGLEKKAKPSTPDTRRKLLNDAVMAFVNEINLLRKKPDTEIAVKGEKAESALPKQVQSQLSQARKVIKAMKERGNNFPGSLEEMVSLLRQDDFHHFTWTHILDHRGYGADLHKQVFERYAAEVDLSKPHAWVQVYDRLSEDLFRETSLEMHNLQDRLLAYMGLMNDFMPFDAGHLKNAANWLNNNADPTFRRTIDGVSHTNLEHAVYQKMRDLVGESDFNKWILWDEAVRREAPTDGTVAEYRARAEMDKQNHSRRSAAPQSLLDEFASTQASKGRTQNLTEIGDDLNDFEYGQNSYTRDQLSQDALEEGPTNMPRIDIEELSTHANRNAEQELESVKPFLDKPVEAKLEQIKAIEKIINDLGDAFPETLRAAISKTENMGRALMKTTQVIIEEYKLNLNAKALFASDLGLDANVALAGRKAILAGFSPQDSVKIMMEKAKEMAVHELNKAYLNVEAVARNTQSVAQLHTNIDGQIRTSYEGKKTSLGQVANRIRSAFGVSTAPGAYVTVARSLDARFKHAKQIATHNIHAAFDAIPKVARSAKDNALLFKYAIKSINNPEAFAGIDADPAAFKAIQSLGREIGRSLEIVRGMLNRAGSNILKNDQFFYSIRHSLPLIRKNVAGWKSFMMANLDWDKVAKNTGQPTITDRSGFLDGMLADLEKANRSTESNPFDPALVDLGSQDQWHRTISFLDTDRMVDYDMQFGSGDTFVEFMNQLNRRAERSVVLEEYGPEYAKNFNHALDLARRDATNKADKAIMAAEEAALRTNFRMVTGELNNPVNQTVASVGQFIRLVGNAAFSWKSGVSALTDVPLTQMVLRSTGAKYHFAMGKHLKAVFDNAGHLKAEAKRFYEGNLAGIETIISSNIRGSLDFGESGFIGRSNDRIYSMNGQQHMTKVGQYQFADVLAHHLGEQSRIASEGGDLDPTFLAWLSKYKISEAQFKDMAQSSREVALHIDNVERNVLLPSMIEDRALRHHLLAAFKDSMDTAVLQPSSSDISALTLGIRSGTVAGETVRCIGHYKSFTMAMNTKVRRQFRAYGLNDEAIDKLMLHRFYGFAGLAGAGLLATQLKDILDGKEPLHFMSEDQRNLDNVKRIIMQAGLFTVTSDLGFSMKQNSDGTSSPDFTLASAIGPVPGQLLKLGQQLSADDPSSNERATRTALNLLPGSTLPMVNTFKHRAIGAIAYSSYGHFIEGFEKRLETLSGQDQNFLDGR